MPDGSVRNIRIINISVTGINRQEYPFQVSGGGNYTEIKIGDPNMTVRGEVLYVIRYDVLGAVRSLPEAKEFFWNAVGNDWDVPIDRVRLEVALPRTLPKNEVAYACYSGFSGSITPCESGVADGTIPGSITMLRFRATKLTPGAGMSVAVAVPPEVISVRDIPTGTNRAFGEASWWKNPKAGFSILLPLLVLVAMLYRWKTHGKDPEGQPVVVREFEPPENIDPPLAGFLLRERVRDEDVSAMILSLAARGYLSIEVIDVPSLIGSSQEILLTKKEPERASALSTWDAILYETLFPDGTVNANTKEITERFKRGIGIVSRITTHVEKESIQRGYYDMAPSRTRGTYVLAAFALFVLGLILGNSTLTPSFIATALVIGIVGWFMPKPTQEGARVRDAVRGYKKYLEVAEKERIRFHTDDALNQSVYEKILPYAIVFNMESAWLARFSEFYRDDEHPVWLRAQAGSHLHAALAREYLVRSMNSLKESISGTRASGFGGIGKVGGGFGGGGGRSW